jgi:beta-phosphoglucomutase-like phosphatase (HAD superfamily)
MRKGHIFDMDGTLIDSIPAYREAAVRVICKHFPSYTTEKALEAYNRTIGRPFSEQLLLNHIHSKSAVNEYHYLTRDVSVSAEPFLEALNFLEKFDNSENDYLAMITSSPTNVALRVVNKHFAGTFDWISGIDFGDKEKQIYSFLEINKVNPENAVFYSDSELDKAYADGVGVGFILVKEPEHWITLTGNHS